MTPRALEQLGTWAVVTGASSGIGRGIALRLARHGRNVVLVGRDPEALREVAAAVERLGSRTLVVALDLAAPGAPQQLDEVTAALDPGLLVNCAGFGSGGDLMDSRLDHETAMVDVNCRAVLELTHRFGRRFVERKRGAIVLASSIVAFQGVARSANYAATKAYVQSLGEALARELAPQGVQVLTAIPGPTASGFAKRAGMNMGATDGAERVADDIVAALIARRTRVVPGRVGKLLFYSLMTAPRRLRVLIMQQIMSGMTPSRGGRVTL